MPSATLLVGLLLIYVIATGRLALVIRLINTLYENGVFDLKLLNQPKIATKTPETIASQGTAKTTNPSASGNKGTVK